MTDNFGRTINGTPFTGGWRYAATDGSFQCAFPSQDDVAALACANANPPPGVTIPGQPDENERVSEILDAMESLSPSQASRLAKILAKVK